MKTNRIPITIGTGVGPGATVLVSMLISITAALAAENAVPTNSQAAGVENAVLTEAPNVPPPLTRKHATKVIVSLEGDEIEFHLNNHQDNKMPHNIDLHAVTGPGGGAASSFTAPGHSSQFSFKAINPGL